MNKKIGSFLKVAAFLSLGLLLVWLSFRQMKPAMAFCQKGEIFMTSDENFSVSSPVFVSDKDGTQKEIASDGNYLLKDSSILRVSDAKVSSVSSASSAINPSDWFSIKKSLREANYWWLILSMLVCVISHLIRAYRWNMLLEPMGHKAKLSNSFFAVMIGYFVNYGVPRLGEVSRCTVIDRYEKIPFTKAFGTVVAERVIDMLIFFIMFFIMLFSQYGKISGYLNENILPPLREKWTKLSGNSTALILMALGALLFLAAIFYFRKKIKGKLGEKVKGFVKGFAEGIRAVGKVKNPIAFIFLSVMIWVCYYAMLHLCFFCLKGSSHLSFSEGITAMVFGTFTVMLTPGGIGAYPLALQKVLNKIYFLPEPVGFAIGWLSWLAGFVVTTILGIVSFVLLPILNKTKDESAS